MALITAERVRELLDYNPETGIFTWRERPVDESPNPRTAKAWNTRYAGTVAGTVSLKGYVHIYLAGRKMYAHRLAWVHTYGEWPENHIDHKDGQRGNNRVANLRDVSISENSENQRRAQVRNKTTGLLGSSQHSNGKGFVAQIIVRGNHKYLGYFKTAEEAHRVYIEAKRKLHQGCTI